MCRRSATSTCKGKNAGFDVEVATLVRTLRVRPREPRLASSCAPTAAREPLLTTNRVDLVISTFTYTADRDTRIDFSRAVLQGDGPPARARTTARSRSSRDIARQDGRDDERLGLRPVDEELLQRTPRSIVADTFTNAMLALQPGPCRRGHVRRRRPAAGRGGRPQREADGRHVPRGAVRHRHQAGQHGDEGVGRLAPRADAQEGPVPADPQGQRAGTVRAPRSRRTSCGRSNTFAYTRRSLRASDTVCP